MSKIGINCITSANIYLDGTNLSGRTEEVRLPDVPIIMQEHKTLGMVGEVELPAGPDKLEGGIEWNSSYRDTMPSAMSPYRSLTLQCCSSVQCCGSQGLIDEIPLVTSLTIMFEKNPLGTFKQCKNAEFPSNFTCMYTRQILDGEELLQLGYPANIFRIGGVGQLANYRINIGDRR